MIIFTNATELLKIIDVEHNNPHSVLGMHESKNENKENIFVIVRQFIPQAKSITIVDAQNEVIKYNMKKIHRDGFFELIIPDKKEWFEYYLLVEDFQGNSWVTYDSYSFEPTISEYDRYLFNIGNHYNIYEKLGAHIREINGVNGVSFAVWAPNAKSVSVVGDFNNWDERRNQMRILGQSGIWEIFIPNLIEGDKYKFFIKTQNNNTFLKSDPYGVYNELRPNTASIVYNISNYKWNDKDWIERREFIDVYNNPMNIYEVHLGSWMRVPEEENRSLTYRELADKLVKYVKDMGYTHIELLPIEEHPFDGSWGYQVTGYYAPTSRYGTPKEFKEFVDTCHINGIGVFLDWVPAHFPKDIHGLANFDGTALYEHQDPKKGEHPEWGTYIFNYGRNEVKNFLIANAMYWIDEYHIDGLRVDAVASMLYLDYGKCSGQWIPNERGGRENLEAVEFLKHMNSIITKKFKGVMIIAEESTSWAGVTKSVEYDGLGFTMKWNMGWMNDYLSYLKKDCIYRKYHQNNITFSLMYAYSENFVLVLSHDEVVHMKGSMATKMPGDLWQKFANLRVAYGYMYGHPGKMLNFMGNEFGQFSEWSETRSLDWHLLNFEHHKKLQLYIKELNRFYINNPSMWEKDFDYTGFEWIECNDNEKSIVSFVRRGNQIENELLFICNFTPETYFNFRVGVTIFGEYKEIFNSDEEKYGGSGVVNRKLILSERIERNKRQNSICLNIPPLGIIILKRILKDTINDYN